MLRSAPLFPAAPDTASNRASHPRQSRHRAPRQIRARGRRPDLRCVPAGHRAAPIRLAHSGEVRPDRPPKGHPSPTPGNASRYRLGRAFDYLFTVLFALDLLPQCFERFEIGAHCALGGERLDAPEAAFELGGGVPQRRFRVDIELAGEVGGGEEDITHLVFQGLAPGGLFELGLEFGDFFFELVEYRTRIGPVEADPRRAFLQLEEEIAELETELEK